MSNAGIAKQVAHMFQQNFESFCIKIEKETLTPQLAAEFAKQMTACFTDAAREGYREFIESFDKEAKVLTHEGQSYRWKLRASKEYLTPFGRVNLSRNVYQHDRGGACYIPLEAAWGMCGEFATSEIRESVLYCVGLNTPEETEQILRRCSMFKPSATAIKHIVEKTVTFIEQNREMMDQAVRAQEKIPEGADTVVVSLDGTVIMLAEKGVKRGRPNERPSVGNGDEVVRSSWKNAMVGTISFYADGDGKDIAAERLATRYIARMPEEQFPRIKKEIENEVYHALSNGGEHLRRVLLMDGQPALWNYTRQTALFDDFLPLIDFYHSLEHLSRASEALFGKQSPSGQAWYSKWAHKLKHEKHAVRELIRSIDYYRTKRKIKGERRTQIRIEHTFFRRNKHHMDYAFFVAEGLPIGSGPVEAACKTIVKQRLCRSGMRWSRDGGQRILTLRAYIKSNRWSYAWDACMELKQAA